MLGGRKLAFSSPLAVIIALLMTVFPPPARSLQFCGQDLANALALVCSETGYNIPQLSSSRQDSYYDSSSDQRYPREIRVRRVTRGIVDECCRSSCGWSTIESYCRPSSSTTPENLPKQKRSDPPSEALLAEQVRLFSADTPRNDDVGIRHEKRRLLGDDDDALERKNNRAFHSADDDVDDAGRRTNSLPAAKVKRNEKKRPVGNETVGYHRTNVNESSVKNHLPRHVERPIQIHRDGRHHRASKYHHKDLKKGKELQVGTIPPFFMGKTLVSPKARRLPF